MERAAKTMAVVCLAILATITITLFVHLDKNSSFRAASRAASEPPMGTKETSDLLAKEAKDIAGGAAIDCGEVPVHGDPGKATACALGAEKTLKPFIVRYDLYTFESPRSIAIVRSPDGHSRALDYYGNVEGVGGPHDHEGIAAHSCPEPIVFGVNARGRFSCFKPAETLTPFSPQIAEPF
jgi:hypothetical protein